MPRILDSSCENIKYAVKRLCAGWVVAFPTETVYGLGGNAYDGAVVSRIFSYKNRSMTKPLSVCYSSFEKAIEDVEVDDRALILAEKFLPGPLTIVMKRSYSSRVSLLCSSSFDTIGIRIPSNSATQKLLSELPFPLTAPSANKSGYPSSVTARQVSESFSDNEELIVLDGGACSLGIESTIIDLTSSKIIRSAAITPDEIKNKCGLSFS